MGFWLLLHEMTMISLLFLFVLGRYKYSVTTLSCFGNNYFVSWGIFQVFSLVLFSLVLDFRVLESLCSGWVLEDCWCYLWCLSVLQFGVEVYLDFSGCCSSWLVKGLCTDYIGFLCIFILCCVAWFLFGSFDFLKNLEVGFCDWNAWFLLWD
jgi:hypothetical protein